MQLDNILNEFPQYRNVQESAVIARLLPHYLKNAELAMPNERPDQGRELAKMVGQNDLSSKSAIFHEKCEIGLYLGRGYPEEAVINGTAYNESYKEVHDIAEKLELQLLQHVARTVSGKELPLFIFIPTRPTAQIFDPTLRISRVRMSYHLPRNTRSGLYSGDEKFVPLEFNPDEVRESFAMFEKFGSQYHEPYFKDRVLTVVGEFIRYMNRRFGDQGESQGQPRKEPKRRALF